MKKYLRANLKFSWKDTLITAVIFAIAFLLCFILQTFSSNDFHVPLIFVLVVVIVSRMTDGYFYGILAAIISVFAVNYIFTFPYFQLDFTLTGYPLTFITMLIVSFVTSTLTTQIKAQEGYIKESEKEKIRADLLRGISHDLRTPLTGIAGASGALLENENIPKEKKRELLKDINDDAQWLIRMVENVLSITKVGNTEYSIHKEPEIVEEIAGAAVAKFRKQWPDIQVKVSVPDEMLFVPMDAMLIEQVIMNILHNSAIHGENCSRILIRILRKKDMAEFIFEDNGRGFSDEYLHGGENAKWQAALTAGRTDRQKNMGIGLSVCRTIIEAHKGSIELSNLPEGGARVCFTLPLQDD